MENTPVLCGKCGANLPEGSEFCPQCGSPNSAIVNDVALVVASPLVCGKCGSSLPAGSKFCLKCGAPVGRGPEESALVAAQGPGPVVRATLPRGRSRPSITLWILLVVLAALVGWVALSDDPAAAGVREDVTGSRAQTIVETPFTIKAHSFSYYEFTVPPGAVNVTVAGDFAASGETTKNDGAKKSSSKNDSVDNNDRGDNVEVYVLTASAFGIWRNGYSTGSFYESGRNARGTINASLPSGAGDYYLVFNNNFSPRSPKTVHAAVLLRYRAVLSESLLRLRERVWGWLGFD